MNYICSKIKHLKNLFVVGCLLLCLSSCSSLLFLDKTLAPEIIPEKEHNVITFVNDFDYTLPVYVKSKNAETFNFGVANLIDGLSSAFSKDGSFSFLVTDTLNKSVGIGLLTTLMPMDSVRAICTRYTADMLLVLDSMNIFFDWETIVEDGGDGSKNKTKNFYLFTTFYISLYSAKGELINRSKVERSSFYKSRPALSGLITFKPSLANARIKVGNLAFLTGQDYVDKFYPKVVQESRKIFTGKVFKESNMYMETGRWGKAIELLEQLTKSPDPKTAEKARQNLSVAREGAGIN